MKIKQSLKSMPFIGIMSALALVGILIAAYAFSATAQTETVYPDPVVTSAPNTTPAPMVIESDGAGNVVLRGVVSSVDTNSMIVTSWGGLWRVRTTIASEIVPTAGDASNPGDLSEIRQGDFVGIDGTFSKNEVLTIDATFVRDWTTDPYLGTSTDTTTTASMVTPATVDVSTNATDASNSVTESISEEMTYSGAVDEVGDTSFVFTDDFDSTYTVMITPDIPLLNGDGEIITLDDLGEGDEVEVEGTASGSVLSASIIHKTSDAGLFY